MPTQHDVARIIREFVELGTMTPELSRLFDAARSDSTLLDALTAELRAVGADAVGSGPTDDIGSYYHDGPPFELRWELPAHVPMREQFADLDRKSQFYILFAEWSRRELEGMSALNAGRTAEAERIFEECLERAQQLEVNELQARSYEDLMRVAERRNDRAAQRHWLDRARSVRQRSR